jgi:hypothetical protein
VSSKLESILMAGALDVQRFPANSRYHTIETLQLELPDGDRVVYLKRRFVPAPESLTPIQDHRVVAGDRLDKLAAEFYGDPELFWQICDANRAMQPQDLTAVVGAEIVIGMNTGTSGGGGG